MSIIILMYAIIRKEQHVGRIDSYLVHAKGKLVCGEQPISILTTNKE
jgi:hypothetical protein